MTAHPIRPSLVLLGASSLVMVALLVADLLTGNGRLWFLTWNLALGWVPYLAAGALEWASGRGRRVIAAATGVTWILFLPNAPYLVTDAVHVVGQPATWLEVAAWAVSAVAGVGLGCASLSIVHDVVARRAGDAVAWGLALTTSALVSVGVYLGRFLRFNSWDALQEPVEVLRVIARGIANPTPFAVITVAFGTAGFFAAYLAYCTAARRLVPARTAHH